MQYKKYASQYWTLHVFFESGDKTAPSNYSMYLQDLDLKYRLTHNVWWLCCAVAPRLSLLTVHSSEDSLLRRKCTNKFRPNSNKLRRRKASLDELAALPFCSVCSLFINYLMNHVIWQIRDAEPISFQFLFHPPLYYSLWISYTFLYQRKSEKRCQFKQVDILSQNSNHITTIEWLSSSSLFIHYII